MSGNIEDILNNFKTVGGSIPPKILNVAAIEWERSIKKNFEAGGRPVKWIPRKRISKKQRGTNILVISGALKNYHAVADITNSRVEAIPDPRARAYAQAHNEGAVIVIPSHPVRHRAKKYKSGKVRTVFASSKHKNIKSETMTKEYTVTIPQRLHTNVPPEDFPRWVNSIKQALQL